MEAFHELKVNSPYEILEIEDIKIFNKPNEHGTLYLKVLIDESINFKYAIEASTDDKICIYEETENKEKTIIFNGTIQNIRTSNVNRLYYMEIEAVTSSFSFDIEEKNRSFQDSEMSYDDLIKTILLDYKIYSFTQCMDRPMSIGKPLFQYKETDYEFLKRVASHLGLQLVCDIINPNNVFYFGNPTGKSYEIDDDIDYTSSLDIKKYRWSLASISDSYPTDFFYYTIKSKKVMEIGSKVTFKEKEFYINSYEAQYVRGDLIFTYKLCRKKGIWQEKLYNDKIKGISLEGRVMEVAGEQVKLHLNIDEAQNQSKAAWFRYAPPTGNLMYSMPIVGTNANLYFPSERSQDPMVIGCVRKNGSSCENFSNVNNRYFATESGNNLDMLPGAINFSRPGLSANFNDGSGITLSSSSNLNISAGYVGIFAGDISIEGGTKLTAKKGESSSISLESDFYNNAGIIMENGSDRASNPKFTDDEPTNGVAEAKEEMMEAIQAAVGAISSAIQGAIGKIGSCLPIGMGAQTGENTETQTISETKNDNFIENKVEDFIDGCGKSIDEIYNKIVGQEITYSEENVGDITYSTKQKVNGDYIIQNFDEYSNFEGFSINAPIEVKVPFTESDYIGINQSISFGKEIEFSVEESYKDGKTEDTKSGSLGLSIGWDNISISSEGKIENKDGGSESINVTHKKIDWGTACAAVAATVVVIGVIIDPVPGDEAAIPVVLELLGLKLAR